MVVVEEPDTILRRGLADRLVDFPTVDRIVGAERITVDAVRAAVGRHSVIDAVIPGTEVGVLPAAGLADTMNLPGAGVRAAGMFRDKIALRSAAASVGLLQPRWQAIADENELKAAIRMLGSGECVLKPSNRAGSLGVTIFSSEEDPSLIWQRTHSTVISSPTSAWDMDTTRYLIEERLTGYEVSVECLVSDHNIVFVNLTDKHVLRGRYPVEVGHQVPGSHASAAREALTHGMEQLIRVTGFGHGILHGEWILTDHGPALVECAARIPGDRIMELIELAYATPVSHCYVQVMRGKRPVLPTSAAGGASIRFLTPEAGVVTGVVGQTDAGRLPGVRDVVVQVAEGQHLGPIRASYDRVGHVVTMGATGCEAWAIADRAADLINIRTR
ncbi:MAG: ATP-grasp domain-containing protein [Micromonosporaceae bacterium]